MTLHGVDWSQEDFHNELLRPDVISGSEILLRSLLLEGVDCVFGYPGGAVLYIYDAMHDNPHFRHLLTRHEQGAIHAADGYARSTGRVGVCIATSGPGATNLVTGIATAYMDSVPLVIITGNTATHLLGTDSFQEVDTIGITMPITKHNFLVHDVLDLARVMREAFFIANSGRKGPVLIDIPKDVSAAMTRFVWPETLDIKGYHPQIDVNERQMDRLLAAIEQAQRPVIIAGGGVVYADAGDLLQTFVERVQVPVATTLLGLSGFPSAHPLALGMPGMHGTYTANQAIQQADLVISIGARFDDRVTMKVDGFAPHAKIAHIDVDVAEIGKNVRTDFPVQGDVRAALSYAICHGRAAKSHEWLQTIGEMQREHPLQYDDEEGVLKPQWIIEMISRTTDGEVVITSDVGQHQMWVAQFYQFRRARSFITSGGLGTMGFGLPAAIGAQMGNPQRLVISVNGDGGLQMCAQELAICAIHNIPIKVVIINNEVLGMVRQQQELFHQARYSHIDLSGSPDFVQLAKAYQVKGLRATTKEEALRVWHEALVTPGPVVIDFVVPRNECVYPMVAPGKAIDDMILGEFSTRAKTLAR